MAVFIMKPRKDGRGCRTLAEDSAVRGGERKGKRGTHDGEET